MAALSPAARPDPLLLDRVRRGQGGCVVTVRAHVRIRDGVRQMVKAHQRADPRCGGAELEPPVVAVATRRRDPSDPLRPVPLEGGPGGGGRAQRSPPSEHTPAAGPVAPDAVRRHLLSILAPGGRPIGTLRAGTRETIRGMSGGNAAALDMFQRLTVGQGGARHHAGAPSRAHGPTS